MWREERSNTDIQREMSNTERAAMQREK